MGLFFGRETRAAVSFPAPPIPPFLGADTNGLVSTASSPDTAMQIPTVWACINLLAGAVSSLQLETFRRSAAPGSVPKRIPDAKILVSPDGDMTQSEWLHMLMVSMLTRGNGLGLLTRDSNAYPLTNHLLNPDGIRIAVNRDTGVLEYRHTRTGDLIPNDRIWHIRGLTMPGSRVGLSPISYAAATLGLDSSSRQFASEFFNGGGIPKAVLESDKDINQEQARTIKDRVMATFRGREPLVMGLGLRYTQIQVKPEESQFLATQQANVTQICRYFGVPAAMVDGPAGGGMQYTNTEQRALEFLTFSLAHWLKRIEDAVSALLPNGQYVRFNTDGLLRLDAETQAKVDVQMLAGKILAPSEIRARKGLDPMTDDQLAEVAMLPLTVTALGGPRLDAGTAPAQTGGTAPAETPTPAGSTHA